MYTYLTYLQTLFELELRRMTLLALLFQNYGTSFSDPKILTTLTRLIIYRLSACGLGIFILDMTYSYYQQTPNLPTTNPTK